MAAVDFHIQVACSRGRLRVLPVRRICLAPAAVSRWRCNESTVMPAPGTPDQSQSSAWGRARGLVILIMGCALIACSRESGQRAADARLRAIYRAEWQWREQQFAGNEDMQKPIWDHLPKVDPGTQQARQRYWENVRRGLQAIARADLSAPEQLNYDVYRAQIETLIANQRFRDFEMPANSDTTFWTELGYTARRPFRTRQDYRNWIAQMRDIPRYFHEQMDEMRAGVKRGFTPPRVTMQGRDASITAVTDAAPEATLFYTPFK